MSNAILATTLAFGERPFLSDPKAKSHDPCETSWNGAWGLEAAVPNLCPDPAFLPVLA